mmetsp:Transcript_14605/g.35247  ORF Transcript_14605/g.35247 Transcript_14605/m.35247 type:complete len:443 (+) Transcript_14605:969-2297(+)
MSAGCSAVDSPKSTQRVCGVLFGGHRVAYKSSAAHAGHAGQHVEYKSITFVQDLMTGDKKSFAGHCAYALGALPFLPPEFGGPFDGPKDHLALLRFREGMLDFIRTEYIPADEAAWPALWQDSFRLRRGGTDDVHETGNRAGVTSEYVLECVANGYVLTAARVYADRIVEPSADEGSETGQPGGGADADTFDHDAFSPSPVEVIPSDNPANPGAGDIDALDDIDSLEDADCDNARVAVAYGAPGDSAGVGAHIRNPFYFAVPATSSSASTSSGPPPVKLPLLQLLEWHWRLAPITGPTIRRALPAVPTHTQHAENAFGHLKHRWLDHRKLPVGAYEYLKVVLPGGGDGMSISEAAESRFRASMGQGLPKHTRQPAPKPEEEGKWGEKGKGGLTYKEEKACGAIQKSDKKPCKVQRLKTCTQGRCGKSGHCLDKQCPAHPRNK